MSRAAALLFGLIAAARVTAATGSAEHAAQLYRDGSYAAALREYEAVLAHTPKGEVGRRAGALEDVARAARAAGDYARAVAAASDAVAARKGAGNDAALAGALVLLADAQCSNDAAPAALANASQALALAQARAPDDPDTARALNSVAEANRATADYVPALDAAQRALAIRRARLGDDNGETAESWNELGVIFLTLRQFEEADHPLAEGLRIRTAVYGPDHPLTAESLNNHAALLWSRGDYDAALPEYKKALDIRLKRLGPAHPATIITLNNLAALYQSQGRADEATALLTQAHQAARDTEGGGKVVAPVADQNLGVTLWSSGKLADARPLLEGSAQALRKARGADHPDTARADNLLAAFYESAHDGQAALASYRRGLPAEERTLDRVLQASGSAQQLRYVEETEGHYLAALGLIAREFHDDDDAVQFALERVLRRKGIVLDAQARTQEQLERSMSGADRTTWRQLSRDRADLARLLLSGSETDAKEIQRLTDAIERQERTLAAGNALIAADLAQRAATAKAVGDRLPRDGVLVEYVRVPDWDADLLAWAPTARYLAFILWPGGAVRLIDLGDAAEIDTMVAETLPLIATRDNKPGYVPRTHAALERLYQRILAPVVAAGGDAAHLFVGPDGELNRVPFAALRAGDGQFLIEQHLITHVASGRDLLRPAATGSPTVQLMLVANPAFDYVPSAAGRKPGHGLRASGFRGKSFKPLAGLAQEASAIPPLVAGPATLLTQDRATESAVSNAPPARIVHFATHGFFLQDADLVAFAASPAATGSGRGVAASSAENPMVRSGLALAGANYADSIGRDDDGILTALEVTNLDLHATDLVVLSACETGIGEVRVGEGVYGLRRAFVLAGARHLVMSLWEVDDQTTLELMERFYRGYAERRSATEALGTAERETIAALRQKYGTAPVYLWAPFIVQEVGPPS